MPNTPTKNYALLAVGVLAASTGAILIRLAMDEAHPLVIAAFRLIFASLISISLVFITKSHSLPRLTPKTWSLMALSGLFLAIHFAAWVTSLQLTSVSSSVVLVSTTPLWVALFSPIFLKEKVHPRFYIGMFLALLGGAIIALKGSCAWTSAGFQCVPPVSSAEGSTLYGLSLALLGAVMAAGYILVGRKLSTQIDTARYTATVYSVAAILLVIMVFLSGNRLFPYLPKTWIAFLALALIPQTLGHSLLNYSLRALPATTVSLALLGEPIGSTLMAMLFLGENPVAGELIGGFLILVGIMYTILDKPR